MRVYFLHGVGMWPGLFTPLGERLDRPSSAPARRGYGAEAVAAPLDEQVDSVRRLLDRRGSGVLVGVSGGATLALACALAGVAGVRGIVTHEPLVGALEPELHTRVADAAASLATDPGRVDDFLFALYGPSWADIPDEGRAYAAARRPTIAREVGYFSRFAPTRASLGSIGVPHLTTVGERSAPERHRVAELISQAGARAQTIPAAGHLVPIDNPGGFVDALDGFLAEVDAS